MHSDHPLIIQKLHTRLYAAIHRNADFIVELFLATDVCDDIEFREKVAQLQISVAYFCSIGLYFLV